MNTEECLAHFDANYDLLFENFSREDARIPIGERTFCRFCGRSEPETTFNSKAHAIPELLGNTQVIGKDECDQCNTLFANNIEDHLGKYTKPYRTLAQIRGKKGVPSYKTFDEKSRIDVVPGKGFEIIDTAGSSFVGISHDEKTLTMTFVREPYIPVAVYKSFVKIALSLIPREELVNFEHAIAWIRDTDHSKRFIQPLIALVTFIPGPRPNPKVGAIVLRRKPSVSDVPFCVMILAFGNHIYQIAVPTKRDFEQCNENGESRITLIRLPSPFDEGWEYGNPQRGEEDFTNHEVVRGEVLPITHHFDEFELLYGDPGDFMGSE